VEEWRERKVLLKKNRKEPPAAGDARERSHCKLARPGSWLGV